MAAIAKRGKVRATTELEAVIDGLRVKALTQLPPFLLSLLKPLRSASTGLSTNLPVLQTSLLLKYQPFYAFLHTNSPRLAKQVERGYVNAARAYYETGMRRYTRALAIIKNRTIEKSDLIGMVSSEAAEAVLRTPGVQQAYERLRYADADKGSVVLAYLADDKAYVSRQSLVFANVQRVPVEALFRSANLVLVDNSSAEFTFIVRFFQKAPSREATLGTPGGSHVDAMSDAGRSHSGGRKRLGMTELNDGLKDAERIWHEVFDPALDYCTTFFQSILSPSPPPAIPLLTLIRLNDRLLATCDARGTLPLIPYLTGQKLAMWPVYRKEMDQHVESLKKLGDEAEGKGLAGFMGRGVKDGAVRQVANRYAALFTCVTALSEEAEEAMIFSSMTRLRAELVRLIQLQSLKIKPTSQQHSFLCSIYEVIIHELVSGPGQTTHPKLQTELSYFRTREEEARRRITVS
ncbi:vacuolar protein sorting-associated protein 52, partial [Tremellales sp. Uapishka_1]